jgi:hypothetical protein
MIDFAALVYDEEIPLKNLVQIVVWIGLWVIASTVIYQLLQIGLTFSEMVWWPTGPRDVEWREVHGDRWAVTNGGRLYQWTDDGWIDMDQRVKTPTILGIDDVTYGINVVTDQGELFRGRIGYTLPELDGPIIAVGAMDICINDNFSNAVYTASLNQIAFYRFSSETWVIYPLDVQLSTSVVTAGCNLYSSAGDSMLSIRVEMPEGYDPDSVQFITTTTDLSELGAIVSIASSRQWVWVLTERNTVFRFAWYADTRDRWEALAPPPAVSNPRLAAGISGFGFGGRSLEHLDLWIVGDREAVWFDRENGTWQPFSIYGKKPSMLSSLTTTSETIGHIHRRLAIGIHVILSNQSPSSTRVPDNANSSGAQ